jgi:pimeloyl-ACP methyl ester carboxylesterase
MDGGAHGPGAAHEAEDGDTADAGTHGRAADDGGLVGEAVDWLVEEIAGNASFDPVEGPAHPQRRWWGSPLREYRWQFELARLLVDPVWRGVGVPRGNGAPLLLIPGFLAGDPSMWLLHNWLVRMGHGPHHAGIAVNVDCSDRTLDRLDQALCGIAITSGRQVAIVGHSRGGHFAKALAHRRPRMVSQVVAMGSGLDEPFDISIPTRLAVAGVRQVLTGVLRRAPEGGCLTTACQCPFARDFSAPFPASVPLTSIYSKGDGVVWWEACIVPYAYAVEVRGSHAGLAVNRHAYRILGELLSC